MQISEYEVIELAENLCNLKKEEGDWIFRIDLVEKGDVLEVGINVIRSFLLYQKYQLKCDVVMFV